MPSMTLDQVMIGGNQFEFTVNRDELSKAKSITFYSIYDNYPMNINDVNKITANIEENSKNEFFRLPEIQ